jgi:hypothetical protein
MRTRLAIFALMFATAATVAQLPAQQPAKQEKQPKATKTYTSAADITASGHAPRTSAKPDQELDPGILSGSLSANLEYRGAVDPQPFTRKPRCSTSSTAAGLW